MALSSLSPDQLAALLDGPALPPPPGVVPDLDDPPNFWYPTIGIMSMCLAIASLAVIMRMYTKISVIRQVTAADYAIILALGFFVGYFVSTYFVVRIAARVHQWNIRLRAMADFLKYVYVAVILYGVCCFFIKLSILLQFIQIFVPNKRSGAMWWACWSLIILNSVYYTIFTLLTIFSCHPVSASWIIWEDGHCINQLGLDVSAAVINTVSDFIILLLPQYSIWRLNRSWRRKLGASFIFFLGIFASVSSAIRMAYSVKIILTKDVTFYTWYDGVWTFAEMTSGILVACIPVSIRFFNSIAAFPLSVFLKKFLGSLASRTHGSSTAEDYSHLDAANTDNPVGVKLTTWPDSSRSDSEAFLSAGMAMPEAHMR